MTWGDLAARARGLALHVAGDAELDALARSDDPAALAEALARSEAGRAGDLAVLERWADERAPALSVISADADVESLRALVRGLVAGVAAEPRLRGAVPTSRLPRAVLRDLAAQVTGPALAARLTHHRHPAAAALAPLLAATPVDLIAVEQALVRWFAAQARRSAGADHALAVHAAQVIDVANAEAALLLAARGGTLDRAAAFIEGGQRLTRAAFAAAAAAPPAACIAALARAFAGTPLADAVAATNPGAVEHAALTWQLATQRRLRRQEPLGLAAVLGLVLARRLEARRLRAAAWRLTLRGAP